MKKAILLLSTGIILSILMIGCSSQPQKPAAENKPTETKPAFQPSYETGREALQKMYIAARSWSADVKPYRLESQPTKDSNGHDGKSGLWSAGFASPSKRELKLFSWSGVQADDTPEPGINSRPADTYNTANTSTQIFDIAFLKIDSPKAFEVAQKNGGEKITKKSPDIPVFYDLEWDGRKNNLFWRVIYGEVRNDPKLAVDVDASTGTFIKVEK
jgi:hypothetical protein